MNRSLPSSAVRTALSFICIALLAGGCATGEKMQRLSPGMTKSQVIQLMGRPEGFRQEGEYEWFQYSNRLTSGWSWDRADYNVVFRDGRVVQYGAGEVRVKDHVVVIIPLRP